MSDCEYAPGDCECVFNPSSSIQCGCGEWCSPEESAYCECGLYLPTL